MPTVRDEKEKRRGREEKRRRKKQILFHTASPTLPAPQCTSARYTIEGNIAKNRTDLDSKTYPLCVFFLLSQMTEFAQDALPLDSHCQLISNCHFQYLPACRRSFGWAFVRANAVPIQRSQKGLILGLIPLSLAVVMRLPDPLSLNIAIKSKACGQFSISLSEPPSLYSDD